MVSRILRSYASRTTPEIPGIGDAACPFGVTQGGRRLVAKRHLRGGVAQLFLNLSDRCTGLGAHGGGGGPQVVVV